MEEWYNSCIQLPLFPYVACFSFGWCFMLQFSHAHPWWVCAAGAFPVGFFILWMLDEAIVRFHLTKEQPVWNELLVGVTPSLFFLVSPFSPFAVQVFVSIFVLQTYYLNSKHTLRFHWLLTFLLLLFICMFSASIVVGTVEKTLGPRMQVTMTPMGKRG